ncbi:MAG: response regulator [Fimbriimonas sp.]
MLSRVLLVEDNPDDELLTLRALKKSALNLDVQIARDGAEALHVLGLNGSTGTDPELPALVLLDIKLPKVSGIDVLRAIRRAPRTEGLPVVMLTSSDEPSDVISASLLNVSRYVRKAVDYSEFMSEMDGLVTDFLGARS